jgi:hypothetical protein
MCSTKLTRRVCFTVPLVCTTMLNCGRAQNQTASQPDSSTVPPTTQTYRVKHEPGFLIDRIGANTIAIDLSSQQRTLGFGDRYPGKDYGQLNFGSPRDSFPICQPDMEAKASAFLDTIFHPVDAANLGTMRLDVKTPGGAPEPSSNLCFAVHTKSGAWAWRFVKIAIVVDSGEPGEPLSAPGTGHFDFSINTNNVDAVAVVARAPNGLSITDVTYTVISP